MSSELVKDLLAESKASQPNEITEILTQEVDGPKPEPEDSLQKPLSADQQASNILSAPEPTPPPQIPSGTSSVLKTRAQLIAKIQEVCDNRGVDTKPLNLKRRRKNSLQGILQEQFVEAVQAEMMPQVHQDLQPVLPEGMEARTKFCLDMAFRFDMTVCMLLERGVSASDSWHGLTADGFVKSIESNPTLVSEIRSAWLEIIMEPDNEWILECVTAPMRLFLAHGYGLLAVLRRKPQKDITIYGPRRQKEHKAMPPLEPFRSTGKLRDLAMQRSESGKEHPPKIPLGKGAGGMVKQV